MALASSCWCRSQLSGCLSVPQLNVTCLCRAGSALAICLLLLTSAAFSQEPPPHPIYPDGYFAICLVVKDQNLDLKEFVKYHHWIGTEKFYIYDHNSTVPLYGVVEDYIRSGVVEYYFFSGHHAVPPQVPRKIFASTAQGYVYEDCLRRARHRHAFMGFIDTDEFIVVRDPTKKNIQELLTEYEEYGGLAVNWAIFGSSGLKKRPKGGVLPSYHKCLPVDHKESNHVKVLVNLKNVATVGSNPHYFRYIPGKYAVNEKFDRVEWAFTKNASWDRIVLNHYVLKSEEEYMTKLQRGGGSGSIKGMNFFEVIDMLATSECHFAQGLYEKCCVE